MSPGTCKSCGAAIEWIPLRNATTKQVKSHPVDAKPAMRIVMDDGGVGNVRPSYVSHFATCPNAAQHRKAGATRETKEPAQAPQPPPSGDLVCPKCGGVLWEPSGSGRVGGVVELAYFACQKCGTGGPPMDPEFVTEIRVRIVNGELWDERMGGGLPVDELTPPSTEVGDL